MEKEKEMTIYRSIQKRTYPNKPLRSYSTNVNALYYMASSMSGQDESNPALTGYPSGQDGAILPALDYPPCPARKISPKAI